MDDTEGATDRFSTSSFDVPFLQREVGLRFSFYDMRYGQGTIAFFCHVDEQTLEEKFDALRQAIYDKEYTPLLRYEKGEYVIYILQKPSRKRLPVTVNVALLLLTLLTCTLTGSLLYVGAFDMWSVDYSQMLAPVNLLWGFILFAVPLMSILFVHEMGHYVMSKRHGLSTSLPFFIPVPPALPGFNIGTFGALISSHDPMHDRKTLFDVGVSGPLAGFAVAVPVTIIGIWMSEVVPYVPVEGEPILGMSMLLWAITSFIHAPPVGYGLELSPVAFAGWVGLLITSINLLPAGQLDGGHVFRAVLGEKQRYASFVAIVVMVLTGWFVFAILIMFMGLVHPPPLNDVSVLDRKRIIVFLIAIAILVICFVPVPISV